MKRSGTGRDGDRTDLGGFHTHLEMIANAEVQSELRGDDGSGTYRYTLRERDAYAHKGIIGIGARDDTG